MRKNGFKKDLTVIIQFFLFNLELIFTCQCEFFKETEIALAKVARAVSALKPHLCKLHVIPN